MSSTTKQSYPKLDWKSAEYNNAPLECLRRLAEAGPIAQTDLGYAVLHREEARPVLRADLPISVYHIPEAISPYLAERTQHPLLLRYGQEHTDLRGMLTRVLRTRVIEALRPRIKALFVDLLEPVLVRGEGDLVAEVFHPFPAMVLSPMLGIPAEDIDKVSAWVSSSARWTNIFNPPETLHAIETAWRSLEAYMVELLARRRDDPTTDVFSELIREMAGHDELEIVGIAMELTRAGMDTTRRQLACTMNALLENPAEWARLSADPSLAPQVVEEGMRYASITHTLARQALADGEVGGLPATAGTVFTVMPMTVNRDPNVFAEPERFDATRSPCPHLTFGFGSHACVGAPLARMEMVEAFSHLAQSIDRIELTGPVNKTDVTTGLVPTTLPVRLTRKP